MNDSIIFDIDGTLWNACPASAAGWSKGLKELGIEKTVTAEDIQRVAGHPVDECVEILFPGMRQRHPELFDVLKRHEIAEIKNQGGVFYEGVLDGIPKLAASYRLFIVSNCQKWYLDILLERAGFSRFIEEYDCNGMSGFAKGQMLVRIKDKYSLKTPVYVGDTADDQTATEIADMKFIYATYGFGFVKNPEFAVGSFVELADFFLKNP